jgi:endonuclease YncB( thermonuclease family)
MSRFLRMLVACLAAGLATAIAVPAADASFKAPCIHGQKRPTCTFWGAKVKMVADGDTIKAVLDDDRSRAVQLIRFNGINAMELSHYSTRQRNRRGACHGVAAAGLVAHYVKRSHWHVRLAAQHASSRSGGRHRLRRSVWVKFGGHWQDLAKIEMEKGLALWLPNGKEWAHNYEYHVLAEQARLAQRGLYDTTTCGVGPDQDIPVAVAVNWDADGNDEGDKNGEYIDVYNNGLRPLSLAGWWVRDSWLRYNANHVPGFQFPLGTLVPAGGYVRVHVGPGVNDGHDFFWFQKRSVFENVTHNKLHIGDGGYLFDPQGDLRASSMYPCVVSCVDPLAGAMRLQVHPKAPERITITNTSAAAIDLQGHVLKLHNHGQRASFVWGYVFTPGTIIGPGQTMDIDPGGNRSNDRTLSRHLGHGSYVLSDNGGTVSLRTATDIVTACAHWGFGHSC